MAKKKPLGRGLSALMGDPVEDSPTPPGPLEVDPAAITPNPWQPRSEIKDEDLTALARSIKEKGLLEPLVVSPDDSGGFFLIAGERRLRASRLAGLEKVPVVVRETRDQAEMLELALIENLHREDLNPIEEAESFNLLAKKFERTTEEIARLAGKDRSTVANTLRLLALPSPVQSDVRNGRLSAGHARALLSLSSPDRILEAREKVLAEALSVRETEALVKRLGKDPAPKKPLEKGDQAYYNSLADSMSRVLGARVKLKSKGRTGRISIEYSSPEALEKIMKIIGVGPV